MPRATRSPPNRAISCSPPLSRGQKTCLATEIDTNTSVQESGHLPIESDVIDPALTITIPSAPVVSSSNPVSPLLSKVSAGQYYCERCKKPQGIQNRSRHMRKHSSSSSPRGGTTCECGDRFTRTDTCMRHMKKCPIAIHSGQLKQRLDEIEWRKGSRSRKEQQRRNSWSSAPSLRFSSHGQDLYLSDGSQWSPVSPTTTMFGSTRSASTDLPLSSAFTEALYIACPWDDLDLSLPFSPLPFSSLPQLIVDSQGCAVPWEASPVSQTFPLVESVRTSPFPPTPLSPLTLPYPGEGLVEEENRPTEGSLSPISNFSGAGEQLSSPPPVPASPFSLELAYPDEDLQDEHRPSLWTGAVELPLVSPQLSPSGHTAEVDVNPFDDLPTFDPYPLKIESDDSLATVLFESDAQDLDTDDPLSSSLSSLLLST